jgi:receptor protein-tyrosine kinase
MTPESSKMDKAAGLRFFLRMIRRRWILVVGCGVVLAAASFAISVSKTKQYSTTATLLFRQSDLDQQLFGSQSLNPSTDPVRDAATELALVSLRTVAQLTSQSLGAKVSPVYVANAVSVSANGQSNLVEIKATDRDPRRAATIANAYAQQYIQFGIQADRNKVQDALTLIRRQLRRTTAGAARGQLLSQQARLKVFAALQTGNAEQVQTAQAPKSPSSPQPKRDTALGLLIGLLLGLALAFVFERLDRRVRDIPMLESLGLTVLASIPESRALATEREGGLKPSSELEAFRMLRARLRYFNVDRDIRTILVASSSPGDGKSTVALHLAVATAGDAGTKVLLIECDMRLPTLSREIDAKQSPGLSELISQHHLTLADVTQTISISTGAGSGEAKSFDYISAGAVPPNPFELIASKRMATFLHEVRERYDFVVLDTPPSSVVSDPFPILQQVDGIIIVSRLDHSTREGITRLNETMVNLNAPILGVVANAVKSYANVDGYGYGYGYGGYHGQDGRPPEPAEEADEAIAEANGRGQAAEAIAEANGRGETDAIAEANGRGEAAEAIAEANGRGEAHVATSESRLSQPTRQWPEPTVEAGPPSQPPVPRDPRQGFSQDRPSGRALARRIARGLRSRL